MRVNLRQYDIEHLERLEEVLPEPWGILEVPGQETDNPAGSTVIIGMGLNESKSILSSANPALRAGRALLEEMIENPILGSIIGSHASSYTDAKILPASDVGIIVRFPVQKALIEVLPVAESVILAQREQAA